MNAGPLWKSAERPGHPALPHGMPALPHGMPASTHGVPASKELRGPIGIGASTSSVPRRRAGPTWR